MKVKFPFVPSRLDDIGLVRQFGGFAFEYLGFHYLAAFVGWYLLGVALLFAVKATLLVAIAVFVVNQ